MTSSSLSASPDYSVAAAQTLNATKKKKFQPDLRPNSLQIVPRRSWLQLDGRFHRSGPVVCQTLVGLFILKFCPSLPSTHAQDELATFKQTPRKYADVCLKTWVVRRSWPLVRVSGTSGPAVEQSSVPFTVTLCVKSRSGVGVEPHRRPINASRDRFGVDESLIEHRGCRKTSASSSAFKK